MGRPADARKYSCAPPSKSRNTSPYQRDDAERPGICRGPRRSPPRGLNRGTLFLVAIRLHPAGLLGHRLLLLEDEPARRGVDDDGVAVDEIALEHAEREGIEHPPLNCPLQRPRAVTRIVPLVQELFLCGLSE